MLPTEKESNALKGYLDGSLLFNYQKEYQTIDAEKGFTGYYHLFITSDDKIEVGDWCIVGEHVSKYDSKITSDEELESNWQKIIATTDTSLSISTYYPQFTLDKSPIETKFPQPSQSFIQKFIEAYNKGESIEEVMVEYEKFCDGRCSCNHGVPDDEFYCYSELFIPKVNAKDNTIAISKIKDSWSREEVETLVNKFRKDFPLHRGIQITDHQFNRWVSENL